jgi:hypothetical protein
MLLYNILLPIYDSLNVEIIFYFIFFKIFSYYVYFVNITNVLTYKKS